MLKTYKNIYSLTFVTFIISKKKFTATSTSVLYAKYVGTFSEVYIYHVSLC